MRSSKPRQRTDDLDDTNLTTGRKKIPQHLDIGEWLRILDLEQYGAAFGGFAGVEDLLDHSEADIKGLGVKIASHRARIVSSLTALRVKHNRNGK